MLKYETNEEKSTDNCFIGSIQGFGMQKSETLFGLWTKCECFKQTRLITYR